MTTSIRRTISFHLLVLLPLLAHAAGCQVADAAQGACAGPLDVRSQEDVAALAECRSVDGDLRITGAAVTDLRGLGGLTSVRYLVVIGTSLQDLSGLSGLRKVDGITLAANPVLANVTGLEGVRTLEGLVITENDALTSVAGLSGLQTVGELTVAANPRLESLDPLSSVGQVSDVSTVALSR